MKGNKDCLLVEIERPYETLIDCGGVELQIDTEFDPTNHARIYGVVKGLPLAYSKPDSEGQIEVGDTIYFHYNVIEDSHIEGKLYSVNYERIFAVEKGDCKCLHAVGDWCLLEPDMEHGEFQMVDGKSVELQKKGDLVVGIGGKKSAYTARVNLISNVLAGISPGDLVYVEPDFEFENTIKGRKYFCTEVKYILGIAHEQTND